MLDNKKDSLDLLIGIMLLLETTFGVLGNLSLLSYYLLLCYKDFPLKVTDLILTHLTIANTLTILFKGVPYTLAVFQWKEFFNDVDCKLLLYIYRLGRSVSIGTIFLLSVFQAINVSPRNSSCKDLKVKASKYMGLFISLFWILYIVVNLIFPIYILNAKLKKKNMTEKRDFGFCSTAAHDGILGLLYAALFVFPEVVFSVFILWSSVSMVVTLYRHKKRVQHIRSTNVSSRASPESRATQSILVLVSTFVTFYTLSSILHACIALWNNSSQWLTNITSIISLCFPSFGPFILMSYDSTMTRLCFVWIKNKKSPCLSRNSR